MSTPNLGEKEKNGYSWSSFIVWRFLQQDAFVIVNLIRSPTDFD